MAPIAERFGVEVHAFCLMTNHYHLLLEFRRDDLRRTLDFSTPTAERMARSRARRRTIDQPELLSVVERVIDLAA